jgi:hypothetical protein
MVLAMTLAPRVHARSGPAASPSAEGMPATETEASSPSPSPSPTEPTHVPMYLMVRVDLGESDAEVEPVVRKRVRERLNGLGLRDERGAARELTVTVRWADAEAGGSESYVVDYEFATLAARMPKKLGSEVCDRCGMGELLAMLDRDIAKLRPQLVASFEVPLPTVAAVPASNSSELLAKARPAPLSTLGKVGVGATVVGAMGVIAGVVLVSIPEKSRIDPNNPAQLEITRYWKPGVPVLSVGLGVVIAGVVMLAVDRARARGRRRR